MSTILVGVDPSERSGDAVAFAHELARVTGADVLAACAFAYDDRPSRASNRAFRDALQQDAEATLKRVAAPLEDLGADRVKLRTFASVSPAQALHELAERERVALVVVGSSHTGTLGRVMPGSTGERLLHGAPCAVAVVPMGHRDAVYALRRIGVAVDDSAEAAAAVRAAVTIARATHGEVSVIGVQPEGVPLSAVPMTSGTYVMMEESAALATRETVEHAAAGIDPDLRPNVVLRKGDTVDELEAASADLDLLVIGSRGYGPLRSVLVGGVSGRLVRVAHTPVIVVPRGVEAPLAELAPATEQAAG
jgi:nucleotide-binding universal stress UspA family protein